MLSESGLQSTSALLRADPCGSYAALRIKYICKFGNGTLVSDLHRLLISLSQLVCSELPHSSSIHMKR